MLERFLALALTVLALGALAAGCGDDDGDAASAGDSPSSSGQPGSADAPTKAKFLVAASDICTRERKELSDRVLAFGRLATKGNPSAEEEDYFPSLVTKLALPSIQSQLDQLRELGIPAGEEEELEAIYTALQQAIDKAKANPPKGSDQFIAVFSDHRRLANEYGLGNCVYP